MNFGYSNTAMVKILTDNQASLGRERNERERNDKEHTQKLERERNDAKESQARALLDLSMAQNELEAFKKKEELNVRLQASLQETQMLRMKVVDESSIIYLPVVFVCLIIPLQLDLAEQSKQEQREQQNKQLDEARSNAMKLATAEAQRESNGMMLRACMEREANFRQGNDHGSKIKPKLSVFAYPRSRTLPLSTHIPQRPRSETRQTLVR
jgi:hypothetical protein